MRIGKGVLVKSKASSQIYVNGNVVSDSCGNRIEPQENKKIW